jgi:hypothetical protein
MKRILLLYLAASSLTVEAIIFPLTTEPYDHNRNPWTSEDTVKRGFPMAILDGVPGVTGFQGVPIAPQYLVTAAHLSGWFTQVRFNGETFQIVEQIRTESVSHYDTLIVRINGTFSSYARIAPNIPFVGDEFTCFGSGYSAGNAIKNSAGKIIGWEGSAAVYPARRWGKGKVSLLERGGMSWEWSPVAPGSGIDSCFATIGDSGAGMFNTKTHNLIALMHGAMGISHNSQSNTLSGCTIDPIFDTASLYQCGTSKDFPPIYGQGYIGPPERQWILENVSPPVRLNAGGPTIGSWVNWSSGYSLHRPQGLRIDTNGVVDPAPREVYNSLNYLEIKGPMNTMMPQPSLSYTAANLLRTESYKVRLHFSGWPNTGNCFEDIRINGATIKTNFNPIASGIFKAGVVEAAGITPDNANKITIEIAPHPGSAKATISAIEILLNF